MGTIQTKQDLTLHRLVNNTLKACWILCFVWLFETFFFLQEVSVLHLDVIHLSKTRKLHVQSDRITSVIKYTAILLFADYYYYFFFDSMHPQKRPLILCFLKLLHTCLCQEILIDQVKWFGLHARRFEIKYCSCHIWVG